MENTIRKIDFEFCGTGKHVISPEKFLEIKGAIFLDIREKEEVETIKFDFKYFNIQVIHIPFHELGDRYNELPKDKLIGAFCSSGTRSAMAYLFLLSKGFDKVKWLSGGYEQITSLLKPGKLYQKTI